LASSVRFGAVVSLGWLPHFSALLFLNGALHLLATAAFATYSPGVVTGALLYLPLGGLALFYLSRLLPSPMFTRAVLAGIAVHAVVALAAFT